MKTPVIVLGAGGHAKVVIDALLESSAVVVGIVDPDPALTGTSLFGIPVLGGDDAIKKFSKSEIILVNGLGANPDTRKRKEIFESLKAKGFAFSSVRHSSAVIGRECEIGEGAQVMAGAVLQNRVRLGANTVVNTRASIDHDCDLQAHVFVSPGAVLCGGVMIAESAFIGAGAVLLPGSRIGANAIVGAGAVVTKAVPDRWIVAGNPAIKIGGSADG